MDLGKKGRSKVPHKPVGVVKVKPHPGKAADKAKFRKGGK